MMTQVSTALWTEALKAIRSKVFWATAIAFVFVGVMLALLMLVAEHPAMAGGSTAIGQKASRLGSADWPSYLGLVLQSILALGPIGYGIVTSWVFGREYSDHTVKDLLALPTRREWIVGAKFLVVVCWTVVISAALLLAAIVAGIAVRIPGWSSALLMRNLELFSIGAIFTILLCPPIAFVASIGRGYLLPIGVAIITLIVTQLVGMGMPGVMPYFPWAIPAVCVGIAGSAVPPPHPASYLVLAGTCIAGVASTLLWWARADQT